MRDRVTPITPLVCDECLHADRDGDGRGWKADLAGGHDDEELELVILCPACSCRSLGRVLAGDTITIDGDPGLRINPIYVGDAVRAIVPALSLEGSDTFNIAGTRWSRSAISCARWRRRAGARPRSSTRAARRMATSRRHTRG